MLTYRRSAWLRMLFSAQGTFVRGVPTRELAFGAIAAAVTALDLYSNIHVRLPVGLQEVGGAVVALILAFRANTAYARFWEARTLWGTVVNASRNLARLVDTHTDADEVERLRLRRWIVLFAHAMRTRLRDEDIAPEATRLLPATEATAVVASPHPALATAQVLSSMLAEFRRRGSLDPLMAQRAESLVGDLINSLGGCERIHSTPTPLGYVLLMERFVAFYLLAFPFGLVARAGWATPLVTMAVAYPVLMLDALAIELDDPFGHDPNDLALTGICAKLEATLLGEGALPLVAVDEVTELD